MRHHVSQSDMESGRENVNNRTFDKNTDAKFQEETKNRTQLGKASPNNNIYTNDENVFHERESSNKVYHQDNEKKPTSKNTERDEKIAILNRNNRI